MELMLGESDLQNVDQFVDHRSSWDLAGGKSLDLGGFKPHKMAVQGFEPRTLRI
ncbi:hypothetical protein MBAV_002353 [Candidatus Magnetobacterium bavaricum]|uniref:Uncharacterized protein n=1 Tax=Candidatus Magnetobacterium bavaricum TaxID=29290 RepID=A0A0F3GU28_9BACT|nr:hypothetical protein MBAV_002353 [Candidatus Magnetobacterium bavaricum]